MLISATLKSWVDTSILVETVPHTWAVIMGKGYQGAAEYCRAIILRKNPRHRLLSIEDQRFNQQVSSDGIFFENYFGSL